MEHNETIELTEQCLARSKLEDPFDKTTKHDNVTLQAAGVTKENDNYSIILSDGYVQTSAIVYKTLKQFVDESPPKAGSILMANIINHKGVIIITQYEAMFEGATFKVIGDPIGYDTLKSYSDLLPRATNILELSKRKVKTNNQAPKPKANAPGPVARNSTEGNRSEDHFTMINHITSQT